MQGVIRNYIRRQVNLDARRRIARIHVEHCTQCGIAHDLAGWRDKTRCRSCARGGLRALGT